MRVAYLPAFGTGYAAAREREVAMHAVVNTMTLSQPLPDAVLERVQTELMPQAREIDGFFDAFCVQPDEHTFVMVVLCDSPDAVERLHQEVGNPWIGTNVGPYVASFDRRVGPVTARAVQ